MLLRNNINVHKIAYTQIFVVLQCTLVAVTKSMMVIVHRLHTITAFAIIYCILPGYPLHSYRHLFVHIHNAFKIILQWFVLLLKILMHAAIKPKLTFRVTKLLIERSFV